VRGSQGRAALLAGAFVAAFAALLLSCGGSLRDRPRNSTDCITQSLIEAGFKQPSVQVYSPETIFEYIDGEADVYLEYHFQTLMVIEAKQGKDRDITIEVYSMASPIAMAVDRCLAPQTGGGDERGIPISR